MTAAMKFAILLLLPFTAAITEDQSRLMDKLKESLDVLCPGVDICSQSKTLSRNAVLSADYISCCRACSCADDCLEGTCCFNDTKPADSVNKIRTCQYPLVGENTNFQARVQPYYMIDSIPEEGCVTKRQSCNVTPPYPWGRILPVISTKTNLIYTNQECARCHGLQEDEYEKWDGEFGCTEGFKSIANFKLLEDMIGEMDLPPACLIIFKYMGGKAYAPSQKCYSKLKMNCVENFSIPDWINMTREEIENACKFGPRSLFSDEYHTEPYYNIYCYLCSGGSISTASLLCSAFEGNRGPATFTFAALLSFEAIFRLISPEITSASKPIACKHEDTFSKRKLNISGCRELICPVGQTRSPDGKCVLISKNWQGVSYSFLMDLQLDSSINTLLPLQTEQITKLMSQILQSLNVPPFWKNNFISQVYPCDGKDSSNDVQFSIGFFIGADVPYDTVLATAGGMLGQSWMKLGNGLKLPFRLSSFRHAYLESIQQSPPILTPIMPFPEQMNFTKWCHKVLKYEESNSISEFQVNSLLLCEQVYLLPTEYRIFEDHRLPHGILQYQNRIFFSAEFDIEKQENGEELARICVEDSGFTKYNQPLMGGNLAHFPAPFMILVSVMLCIIVGLRTKRI